MSTARIRLATSVFVLGLVIPLLAVSACSKQTTAATIKALSLLD